MFMLCEGQVHWIQTYTIPFFQLVCTSAVLCPFSPLFVTCFFLFGEQDGYRVKVAFISSCLEKVFGIHKICCLNLPWIKRKQFLNISITFFHMPHKISHTYVTHHTLAQGVKSLLMLTSNSKIYDRTLTLPVLDKAILLSHWQAED